MWTKKNIFLLLLFLMIIHNSIGIDPFVQSNVGLIKGLRATDGDYSMFLGIPYAKINLNNPFGLSTPYPVFDKTFEAYDDSSKCPQFDAASNAVIGTLDCLNLNIYVPNSATYEKLLPVMVSIHGGGFSSGFGGREEFGPKFIVRHDVILVTFNYRVGVYGFMCLGTPTIPGNQGLKDQLIALRWVKANIREFGGDPAKITIVGESAGGRSVDFHLMAKDENLFNKAILQSANSLSLPGVGEVNTELPIVLAKYLGFDTDNFTKAVTYLTTVGFKLLVSTSNNYGIIFQACVENELDGVERFISNFTIYRLSPKVKTTPILLGFNNNEKFIAHVFKDNTYYKGLDFFGNFLRDYFTFDENELIHLEKLIRTFYIEDNEIGEHVKQKLSDFDSDFTYIHTVHRRITQYILNGAEKIYYYKFSYNGERNHFKKGGNVTVPGAIHADELRYLYDLKVLPETPNPKDQLIIDRMTTMWTNFVKCSDPTPDTNELLPVKWKPISESNWYYYSIDSELSLKNRPFNSRMTFLDLFYKMNEKFQKAFRQKYL